LGRFFQKREVRVIKSPYVLIVDDQPDVRLAFAFMLDALGCKIAEAADGRAALEHLAKNRVDIVLADLYMPDMNGMELIELIGKLPLPRPKIIAMTGSEKLAYGASLQAASIVGADAVLRKPITRAKLMKTIQDLMDPSQKSPPWRQQ
jgi:CheY-like chemotaxis protein